MMEVLKPECSRYAFNVVAGEVPGVLDKLEEEDSWARGRKRAACGCHEVLLYLVNSARPRWRSRCGCHNGTLEPSRSA